MRTYPTRKRYIYELPTIFGTVVLQFMQATSNEALADYKNLKEMDDEIFVEWYTKVLKSWVIGYKKRRYITKYAIWYAIRQDIFKIYREIAEYRYKQRISIYKDLPEVKPDKHRKRALFNTDAYLAEKCNCRIDEARDILTDEQIGFLMDDAQRDYYESFDAGKQTNNGILQEKGRTLSQQEQELKDYMFEYEKRKEIYKQEGLLSDNK